MISLQKRYNTYFFSNISSSNIKYKPNIMNFYYINTNLKFLHEYYSLCKYVPMHSYNKSFFFIIPVKVFQRLVHQFQTNIRLVDLKARQWNSVVICLLSGTPESHGHGFVDKTEWQVTLPIQLPIPIWLSSCPWNIIWDAVIVKRLRHLPY